MVPDAAVDGISELYIADVLVFDQVIRGHAPLAAGNTDDKVVFLPDGSGLVLLSEPNVLAQDELLHVDLSGATPGAGWGRCAA